MFNFAKKSNSQPQETGENGMNNDGIQPWGEELSENVDEAKLQTVIHEETLGQGTKDRGVKAKQKKGKPKKKRAWWIWVLAGLVAGSGSSGFILYRGWQELEALVPEEVETVLIYTRPGTMTVKAADNSVIEEIGPISHDKVKIWEVPEMLSQSFISSEDRRFYDHFGVDVQGIARAAVVNFQAGEVVEGGSSITQQVARIVFLTQEKTAMRKLKEMRLATKLEERFSKEQILESYLNLVYLGSGAYGVADAAWVYFGKTVDELTLPETAMIAGLAPAPSDYSPFVNETAAIARRNQVLQRMRDDGFISQAAMDQAIATPLKTNRQVPKRLLRKYPYFSDYIETELEKHLTPEQRAAGGIVVETTLDPQWQEWAEKVVADGITQYGRYQGFKQAALVSVDPRNGQIKTMVGGLDFENNQYNRVTQAQRQPGSTFKTFVYTTAIASGMTPNKTYVDREFAIDGYKPKNYSGTFSNQAVSLTEALTKSINTIALSVMLDVGWNPIIKMAQRMGIRSEMKPTYSLALGAWEVNLLELTSAYGTLANKGVHQPSYGISRILDRNGKVIYQADLKPVQALDANSAAIMTSMLTNVVTDGTGRNANIGRPVAGKTGTSDKARDLWFIGYIPQMVTGVWLGNDDNKPTWGASSTAARLWGNLMKQITASMPVETFPKPNLSGRKGSIKAEPIKGGARKTQGKPSPQTPRSNSDRPPTETDPATGTVVDNEAVKREAPNGGSADQVPPVVPVPDNKATSRDTTPTAKPPENAGSAAQPTAPAPTRVEPVAPTPRVAPPSPPAASKPIEPAPPAINPTPTPTTVDIPAPPVIQKKEATPETGE